MNQLSENDHKYCLEHFDKQKEGVILTFNHFLTIETDDVGEWFYTISTPGGRCGPLQYVFTLDRQYNDHEPQCYTDGHYEQCFDQYISESTDAFYKWLNDVYVNKFCDAYDAHIEMNLVPSRRNPRTGEHDGPLRMQAGWGLKFIATKWTF